MAGTIIFIAHPKSKQARVEGNKAVSQEVAEWQVVGVGNRSHGKMRRHIAYRAEVEGLL